MTKTLTIRDEVYNKLVSVKWNDESFSELFERLVDKQSPSEILKGLRGRIELGRDEERKFLAEVDRKRDTKHFEPIAKKSGLKVFKLPPVNPSVDKERAD